MSQLPELRVEGADGSIRAIVGLDQRGDAMFVGVVLKAALNIASFLSRPRSAASHPAAALTAKADSAAVAAIEDDRQHGKLNRCVNRTAIVVSPWRAE